MPKGAIVLVPFPFTDLSGHKVRPALALYASKKGEDCVMVFVSSKHKKLNLFDVPAPASRRNGLKVDSVIIVEKIATLQKKIILGRLGTLESSLMTEVTIKLKRLFSL